MNTRTPRSRSTSFLVAIGCPHGALPRRVELPIEEYQDGGRRVVRAYLPGADVDRDITVTLRGSQLTLRCQRRVEFDDCSAAPHEATFEKVLNVATGTAPDHVAVDYVDGVLLVSWPMASSLATAGPGARRPSLRRGTVDLSTHRAELPS